MLLKFSQLIEIQLPQLFLLGLIPVFHFSGFFYSFLADGGDSLGEIRLLFQLFGLYCPKRLDNGSAVDQFNTPQYVFHAASFCLLGVLAPLGLLEVVGEQFLGLLGSEVGQLQKNRGHVQLHEDQDGVLTCLEEHADGLQGSTFDGGFLIFAFEYFDDGGDGRIGPVAACRFLYIFLEQMAERICWISFLRFPFEERASRKSSKGNSSSLSLIVIIIQLKRKISHYFDPYQ